MSTSPNPLAGRIAELWERNKPVVRERLDLLERAATQLEQTGTLDTDLRTEAVEIAHKLAGSLGMFGHGAATLEARNIEIALDASEAPDATEVRKHVEALKAAMQGALN